MDPLTAQGARALSTQALLDLLSHSRGDLGQDGVYCSTKTVVEFVVRSLLLHAVVHAEPECFDSLEYPTEEDVVIGAV